MKLTVFAVCFYMLFAPLSSHAVCVKASVANIRSGPGKGYEIKWQVYRFMPFEKVGTSLSGAWYAIRDVDGDTGWIHRKLVTSKYRCAVVKTKVVNIRKGPGTKYPKKFSEPAERYDSFRIMRRQGSWVKVQNEWSNGGWIHRDYLYVH